MIVKKIINQQQIDINDPIDVILPETKHRILYNAFKGIKIINNIYNIDNAITISPTAFEDVVIINKKDSNKNIVTSKEPVIITENIQDDKMELNNGICTKNTLLIYLNDIVVSRLIKSGDYIWCFRDNKLEYINGQFRLNYNNKEYVIENCKLTDDVLDFNIYTIK
jgi:hypothetical protein